MLYARFIYPDYGYDCDVAFANKMGLKVGERYEVEDLSIGGSYTSIFLKGIKGAFNSVQFEFEEDGERIDIFRSPVQSISFKSVF